MASRLLRVIAWCLVFVGFCEDVADAWQRESDEAFRDDPTEMYDGTAGT